MPSRINFHFVDVFADAPLHGNPVVLVEPADGLDEAEMKALAREFNQSETTFIRTPTDPQAAAELRSFTPNGSEVYGAGHNALGAWLWWADSGRIDASAPVDLLQQIGGDLLPVRVGRSQDGRTTVAMTQSPPVWGATVRDTSALAAALGLRATDLDPVLAPQVVSTGAGHLLVALTDRTVVDRVAPDARALTSVLQEVEGEGCYIYSLDPVDPTDAVAYARFFNPIMGISEDPATGTAAGPLVAALVAAGRVEDGRSVVVEQGFAAGRPSRVRVRVTGERVEVSGSGVVSAHGTLVSR